MIKLYLRIIPMKIIYWLASLIMEIILQSISSYKKALSFDEQDKKLGMDTYYLEYYFGEDTLAGYGICKKIITLDKEIIFQFKSNKLNIECLKIDIEKQFEIYNSTSFRKIFDDIYK